MRSKRSVVIRWCKGKVIERLEDLLVKVGKRCWHEHLCGFRLWVKVKTIISFTPITYMVSIKGKRKTFTRFGLWIDLLCWCLPPSLWKDRHAILYTPLNSIVFEKYCIESSQHTFGVARMHNVSRPIQKFIRTHKAWSSQFLRFSKQKAELYLMTRRRDVEVRCKSGSLLTMLLNLV